MKQLIIFLIISTSTALLLSQTADHGGSTIGPLPDGISYEVISTSTEYIPDPVKCGTGGSKGGTICANLAINNIELRTYRQIFNGTITKTWNQTVSTWSGNCWPCD